MISLINEKAQKNIGIFDSGIGGFWLLLELKRQMPFYNFFYFADSGFAPWGGLSNAEVLKRSEKITEFLIGHGCESIVVACNTATSQCINHLRSNYQQKFFGIEPAIKPAGLATKTGAIGLLATNGTLNSERVRILISRYSQNCTVEFMNFPGAVELIENGESIADKDIAFTIKNILDNFREKNVDTIILGCTHYRYFYDEIIRQSDGEFKIIEPVYDVAKHISKELSMFKLEDSDACDHGSINAYTSSIDTKVIQKHLAILFPTRIPRIEKAVAL